MPFDPHPACAEVSIVNRETGEVACRPRRKKVACIGFATNSLHLVPWFDDSFELWSMNQLYLQCGRRTDRHFEMHQLESMPDARDPAYLEWLRTCPIPLYMIEPFEQFPMGVRYPVEAVMPRTRARPRGRDYFQSTVAYMLGLAEHEDFEEIHLYGINLAIGDEYFYEKPNAEYWLGRLEAQGRLVYIPKASSLLKQVHRYGYDTDSRPQEAQKTLLNARIQQYRAEAEQLAQQFHEKMGHMREAESLLHIAEGVDHGADIVLQPVPVPPPAPPGA